MSSPYTNQILKVVVAQISQTIGWHSIQSTPLELLVDILHKYMQEITRQTYRFAELYNRTEPNLDDIALAYRDMNINLTDLEEYIEYVDPVTCAIDVPKYPINKDSHMNFLKPGSKEVLTRPVHINEYLPPINPVKEEDEIIEKREKIDGTLDVVSVCGDDTVTPYFKRPGGPSGFDNSSTKKPRIMFEEEGRPIREISSVIMTTSGFISPAREGKLPDAKTPMPPPEFKPPPIFTPTPSLPLTNLDGKFDKKIKKKTLMDKEKKKKIPKELMRSKKPGFTIPKAVAPLPSNTISESSPFPTNPLIPSPIKKKLGKNPLKHKLKEGKNPDKSSIKRAKMSKALLHPDQHGSLSNQLNNPMEIFEVGKPQIPPVSQFERYNPSQLNNHPPFPSVSSEKLSAEPDKQKLNIFKKISKVKEEIVSIKTEINSKTSIDNQQPTPPTSSIPSSSIDNLKTKSEPSQVIVIDDESYPGSTPQIAHGNFKKDKIKTEFQPENYSMQKHDDLPINMSLPKSQINFQDYGIKSETPHRPTTKTGTTKSGQIKEKKEKKTKIKEKVSKKKNEWKDPFAVFNNVDITKVDEMYGNKTKMSGSQFKTQMNYNKMVEQQLASHQGGSGNSSQPNHMFPFFPFAAGPGLIPTPGLFPFNLQAQGVPFGMPQPPQFGMRPGTNDMNMFQFPRFRKSILADESPKPIQIEKTQCNVAPLVPESLKLDVQRDLSPVPVVKTNQEKLTEFKPIVIEEQKQLPPQSTTPVPDLDLKDLSEFEDLPVTPVKDKFDKKDKHKKEKKEKEGKIKKKKDKKEKLKNKEKSERKKEKEDKREKDKEKTKREKKEKRKEKERALASAASSSLNDVESISSNDNLDHSSSVPKLTLKLGPTSSPRPETPEGVRKITIKPVKKEEIQELPSGNQLKPEREPSPELARISALVTRPPKQSKQIIPASSTLATNPATTTPSSASTSSLPTTIIPTSNQNMRNNDNFHDSDFIQSSIFNHEYNHSNHNNNINNNDKQTNNNDDENDDNQLSDKYKKHQTHEKNLTPTITTNKLIKSPKNNDLIVEKQQQEFIQLQQQQQQQQLLLQQIQQQQQLELEKNPNYTMAINNHASSYIDAEGNQVWICPACGRVDDGTPMIGCDGCDAWYHWVCVGIQVPPDATEDWYCRVCIAKKQESHGTEKKKKRKKKDKKEH